MLDTLAASPLVRALAWTLLHFIWQGAIIAAALALALTALPRAAAATRYRAACAALLLLASAPAATLYLFLARPEGPSQAVALSALTTLSDLPATRPSSAAHALTLLVLAWFLGALLMTFRLAFGLAHLRRVVHRHTVPLTPPWQACLRRLAARLGVFRPVRLLASARVAVPMVVGHLRPAILVPLAALASLPPTYLEAILAHELAHVRRRDYLVNLLQSLAEAVLFYHPAVHWVSHRIRIEREHCCDDDALALTGDALNYARALTALEDLRAPAPEPALASTGGSLMHRIKRIIDKDAPPPAPPRAWAAPALLAAGALALLLAGLPSCGRDNLDPPTSPAAAAPADNVDALAVDIPWLPPALNRWKPAIVAAAARYGIDPDALAILTLVESHGDPRAQSPTGAVGLMQIMPATAARIARERALPGHDDARLWDPEYNIDLGAWYFAQQLATFGAASTPGAPTPLAADAPARAVELAAAAYNGGPASVRAYLDGTRPLSEETERYKALVAGMWLERGEPQSKTYASWRERVRGRLAQSAEDPLPGAKVTQPFGRQPEPFTGGDHFHEGIDLAAAPGEPVVAPIDGTVQTAGADGDRGVIVVLTHGNGIETRYHHLGDAAVHPGQHVGRGDVIGTVGATGKVTGPHLHFEVRDDGAPLDPSPYLAHSGETP